MSDNALTTASDNGGKATAIYILHLAGFITGITPVIGLIMAYVFKDDAPDWLVSHYRNAIHIFWKGLVYMIISILLTAIVIGAFLLLVQMIWFIVRCVKGLNYISKGQPYPNPESWGF